MTRFWYTFSVLKTWRVYRGAFISHLPPYRNIPSYSMPQCHLVPKFRSHTPIQMYPTLAIWGGLGWLVSHTDRDQNVTTCLWETFFDPRVSSLAGSEKRRATGSNMWLGHRAHASPTANVLGTGIKRQRKQYVRSDEHQRECTGNNMRGRWLVWSHHASTYCWYVS